MNRPIKRRSARIGDEIAEGLEQVAETAEGRSEDLRRGNVILIKDGKKLVLQPGEAVDLIDHLIAWATDEKRRPLRIEL